MDTTASAKHTRILLVLSNKELREFKKAFSRAVNTWEAAPSWIKNLYIDISKLSEAPHIPATPTISTTGELKQQSLPL